MIQFKTICYGCIGTPRAKLYVGMDYGSGVCSTDKLAAELCIWHKTRRNPPYLFKGMVDHFSPETRKDRYNYIYEPLSRYAESACDSISTVYETIIETKSSLVGEIYSVDEERWEKDPCLIIRQFKTETRDSIAMARTWFYVRRTVPNSDLSDVEIELHSRMANSVDFFNPGIFANGDVSKVDLTIQIDIDDRINCDTLVFYTHGPINLISCSCTPDFRLMGQNGCF